MILRKWEQLPEFMQTPEVAQYYEILQRKKASLVFKRLFDIVVSLAMILVLSPIFLILAIAIKTTSKGPVFFRQTRVTRYGEHFRIYKFRTMVQDAEKIGLQVTAKNDSRITKVGKIIRKCRLDEISQLLNVLDGSMTFVGTRPEVPKYVEKYTREMMATLLLPAGITSNASILFRDEDKILENAEDMEKAYIEEVLPPKMRYNLEAIKQLSFWGDIAIMFKTFATVAFKRNDAQPNQATDNEGKNESADVKYEKVH